MNGLTASHKPIMGLTRLPTAVRLRADESDAIRHLLSPSPENDPQDLRVPRLLPHASKVEDAGPDLVVRVRDENERDRRGDETGKAPGADYRALEDHEHDAHDPERDHVDAE